MAKWIEYTPKFTSEAALFSYLGLISVLSLTQVDQTLGSLKVTKPKPAWSTSSEKTEMQLRTMLVGCMASFLEYQVSGKSGKAKADMFGDYGGEDDYGDYGADYGSDDEYVTEDIGNAKKVFGDINFGMNPDLMLQDGFADQGDYFGGDGDTEDDIDIASSRNEDEEIILIGDLMNELTDPTGEKTKREMLALIMEQTLKSLGNQTIQMILTEEANLFSANGKDAILKVFE